MVNRLGLVACMFLINLFPFLRSIDSSSQKTSLSLKHD